MSSQAIINARAEKRRRTKKNPAATSRTVAGAETATETVEGEETPEVKPTVTRQQVTRQVVRTIEDGKRVVSRQQPKAQSRSERRTK